MKVDVVIAPLDRGILGRNADGTYKYVYTVPPTWEIHVVDNLKRDWNVVGTLLLS